MRFELLRVKTGCQSCMRPGLDVFTHEGKTVLARHLDPRSPGFCPGSLQEVDVQVPVRG